MTDHDVLSQAVRALRAEHTGRRTGSGFTRARVMKQLHQTRRRRLLRWLGLTPVAALVAGSAWAQATDSWPQVLQSVRTSVSAAMRLVDKQPSTPATPPPEFDRRGVLKDSPTSAIAVNEPTPPAPHALDRAQPDLPTPDLPNVDSPAITDHAAASNAGTVKSSSDLRKPPRTNNARPREPKKNDAAIARPTVALSETAPIAASEPPVEQASPDQELLEFRRAHNANFVSRSPSAAIAAYKQYLKRYPHGRFLPEARYNLALLRLKQGQTALAEAELAPFARGAYGGYRQAEAKALLQALEQHKSARP